MKKIVLIFVPFFTMFYSCEPQKQVSVFVNHEKILKNSDTLLEAYSYSNEERKIFQDDSFIRTKIKFSNCKYYYLKDTLVLDFGESNWLKEFFKIKINNNTAIIDLKTPAFWDKKYNLSENIDSINIILDTLKKENENSIKMKLFMKRHFFVYWHSVNKEIKAYEIFDDTCILRKKD